MPMDTEAEAKDIETCPVTSAAAGMARRDCGSEKPAFRAQSLTLSLAKQQKPATGAQYLPWSQKPWSVVQHDWRRVSVYFVGGTLERGQKYLSLARVEAHAVVRRAASHGPSAIRLLASLHVTLEWVADIQRRVRSAMVGHCRGDEARGHQDDLRRMHIAVGRDFYRFRREVGGCDGYKTDKI